MSNIMSDIGCFVQEPAISADLNSGHKESSGSKSHHNYCRSKTNMKKGKVTIARPFAIAARVGSSGSAEKRKSLKGTQWIDSIVKQISISFPVTKLDPGMRAATLGRIIPVEERLFGRSRIATLSFGRKLVVGSAGGDGCSVPTNCAPSTSTVATSTMSYTRPAVALVPAFVYSFTWHADIIGNKLTAPRLPGSTDSSRTTVQWTLTSLVPLRSKPFATTEAPSVDLQRRLMSITNQLNAHVVVTPPRKLSQQRKTDKDSVSKKTNLENIVSNLQSGNHTARVTGHTKEPGSHVVVHLSGVTNHVKIIEQIPDVDEVAEGNIVNGVTCSHRNISLSNENNACILQLLNAETKRDRCQKPKPQDKSGMADGDDYPIDCSMRYLNWTSGANKACDMSKNDGKQRQRNQSKKEPPNDVVTSAPQKRRLSEPNIDILPKLHPKRNAFSDPEDNACNELTTKDSHYENETETTCGSIEKANARGSLVGKSKRMAKRVLKDDFIYF